MSLARKRNVKIDDINFKLAEVAEKGVAVVYDHDNDGFVRVATTLTALPLRDKCAGILMICVLTSVTSSKNPSRASPTENSSHLVLVTPPGDVQVQSIFQAEDVLNPDGMIVDLAS